MWLEKEAPDFAFVYLGLTDNAGHDFGWMGEKYLEARISSAGKMQEKYQRALAGGTAADR